MLHIFLTDRFESLEPLLEGHRNVTKFEPTNRNVLYGLNVWMIYVVGETNRQQFEKVLKKCPLNFNSHVFEFFEQIKGMLIKFERRK